MVSCEEEPNLRSLAANHHFRDAPCSNKDKVCYYQYAKPF
jgi:hypothetical protein